MYSYACAPVAQLASQLKRGPTRLRLRQLTAIEFLLTVVEAARKYPAEFVQHNLTGYRQRAAETGRSEAPLLSGEDLRTDLITLAEDLSGDAPINVAVFPEMLSTVQAVAKRFDVSTKTVFRWHYRGLIGWRVRFADRRLKLVFPERCIRRFVAQNLDLVQRGSSFSQLSEHERETIVTRARQLTDAGEKTINAVARVLASETGRAVETIRLILKAHDDAHPGAGVFNRSTLKIDADDIRLKVWDAHIDGASVASLAERFDRTAAWVYAVITEMRARELKSRTITFIHSPELDSPNAEAEIVNHPAALSPTGAGSAPRRTPSDLPPYLQHLFRIPLLTPEGEVALFRKLNYLRMKADAARKELDPLTCTALQVDACEALLEQAQQVKNQIVQSNLRLVVSIAKRHARPNQDFFEIVSDGNISLMRAVDKFDYSRGFKFSTYASWAIMKNYARTVPDERTHRDRYQTGREEYLESSAGLDDSESENEYLPAVRNAVEKMLSALEERERAILRQRFGLDDSGEMATLEQIGQRFGVSKERIRQIEARAMAKLRADFEIDVKSLLNS